ncbi:beta-ketoacyl-ACP synthase II [Treponema sp. Marseille-Q4523]|uniref:beta-ketoacyl-ACP synthase II n=1 Tax=Treponema sp. Marseille-Q4523 TaxID=2810610 RepID=UPI0019607EB9|nr:beta-ketoacyl-ACP synthase II [Treponema sp. Marseille-Q4523]MBM7022912.1 beta-ketoacyl-ACP synthase II [Treponema sp. Marseille-Q4523]
MDIQSRRRVVITGLGAVTPLGNDVASTWAGIKAGKSGIGKITLFDASDYPVRIAAEVKDFSLDAYGSDHKVVRKMARFTRFLTAASLQAVRDAGYDGSSFGQDASGIVNGVGIGGYDAIEDGFKKYCDPRFGVSRLPPLTAPMMLQNEAAANVSMLLGVHGPVWTISTACASGTDAIGLASDLIRSGRVDVCIGSGTEACITGFSIGCFQVLQALASSFNDCPEKASRPFDKARDGFVMAEGSAALVLEELEHAKKRGARIYAEIAGYGSSSDAYHITAPSPDGSGGALCIERAFADAGMQPSSVQYYNAHGTSTQANDETETKMIKRAFGDHAYTLAVSSTKSMTGHMIGAAGVIEALFCVKAIGDGFAPPTMNLDEPDVEHGCDLDYVPNKGRKMRIDAAASVSLGFGGHNGCVIVKRYE